MIVDFRIRPPYKSYTDTHLYAPVPDEIDPVTVNGLLLDLPLYKSRTERSMDHFIEEMDEADIDVGVIMGRSAPPPFNGVPNAEIAELVSLYPGRFVGFGGIDGSDVEAALAEIDRCVQFGFSGIALDNGFGDPPLYDDDPRLNPIYERCAELGLIVSITSSIFVGPDLTYSDPVHIQRVARKHPELTIVVPHAMWPWTTLACGVAFQCPNVYLIPDFYGYIPNTPGARDYVDAANYYLGHRLLFGSSYPVRPLGQSVEQFKSLDFANDETRDRALGLNAARILGIDHQSN